MDEIGRKRLWDDYKRTGASDIREKLILEYAPLVKLVAGRLSMYLGYNVEYDDLCSYGIFGLIDAIDKFDMLKDVKFETYASLRIRGSILDQIRKMDWIPRTVRQRQKQISAAIAEVEAETGKTATDEQVALALGITEEEYAGWQSQMNVTNIVSLDDFVEQGSDVADNRGLSSQMARPEEHIENEELKKMLADSLNLLTEKERMVVVLYYYEELTLKEISNVLEVSESRVSQLHTKALGKMKTKMGNYMGIITSGM